MSSPFLRCLMTSRNLASELPKIYNNSIYVQEEFGEVMYSCDFPFNVLPELHLRV